MEIKLVDLKSKLWDEYHGAYGNVSHEIATLMNEQTIEKQEYHNTLYDLYNSLSHQMSFYKATYLALPYLIELLERDSQSCIFDWQLVMIIEIGICLATDFPDNHIEESVDKDVLDNYEKSIIKLQTLTKQFITKYEEEIKALDFDKRTMLITVLLAIFGDREMAFLLVSSGWEQCCILCDHCDYCDEDIILSDEETTSNIIPAQITSHRNDDSLWYWISHLLEHLDAKEELKILSYYYGSYTCPECGKKSSVFNFMKNYFFEE